MAEQQHTEITTTTETVHEEQKSSLLTDILTIIGFAILFIIIIWGLVHLLGSSPASFSPSKPVATIQVSAPAQTTSGESVSISWNYAPARPARTRFCTNARTASRSKRLPRRTPVSPAALPTRSATRAARSQSFRCSPALLRSTTRFRSSSFRARPVRRSRATPQ